MKFANDYSFRKYMEVKNKEPNSEFLFKLLTRAGVGVFAAYSRKPFMSETLVFLLFNNYSLRNKFKRVLSQLRGMIIVLFFIFLYALFSLPFFIHYYLGTAQKTLVFEALKFTKLKEGPVNERLAFFNEEVYLRFKAIFQDPDRNLRELQIKYGFPYQFIVERLQEAMQQYNWTPGIIILKHIHI